MMKSIVADTILESSDKKTANHMQRSQNGCEQIEERERRAVGDCKGHRTHEHPVPTDSISREVHDQQEPLASSVQFLQPPRTRMPLQPI